MKSTFKNVIQLLDYFKDEETCKQYLALQIWNGKPTCPHCNADKPYVTNRGYKCSNKECHKKFTVTVGTIFENGKIPLRYWYAAIYLCTNHKKGISSHQLARDLDITQKTAWFILHRVRKMLANGAPQMLATNMVEVDATYVGGKLKNKHAWERKLLSEKQGRGTGGKTAVLGVLERQGNVVAKKVESEAAKAVTPVINSLVAKDCIMVTDAHSGYKDLKINFDHIVVNHQEGEYVKDKLFHTNNIEGFWSQMKRGIYGIYHNVSVKHLDVYCSEYAYRYNTRKITDIERFEGVLKQSNIRLKYADLIAE